MRTLFGHCGLVCSLLIQVDRRQMNHYLAQCSCILLSATVQAKRRRLFVISICLPFHEPIFGSVEEVQKHFFMCVCTGDALPNEDDYYVGGYTWHDGFDFYLLSSPFSPPACSLGARLLIYDSQVWGDSKIKRKNKKPASLRRFLIVLLFTGLFFLTVKEMTDPICRLIQLI